MKLSSILRGAFEEQYPGKWSVVWTDGGYELNDGVAIYFLPRHTVKNVYQLSGAMGLSILVATVVNLEVSIEVEGGGWVETNVR